MKMGGNESATKYFQSHGGSAALASKDHKAKYTSNAATKYKEELTRRCAVDAKSYVLDAPPGGLAVLTRDADTPTRLL
jgi:ADP-ribosylation factor GTPase-activating protein 2/3